MPLSFAFDEGSGVRDGVGGILARVVLVVLVALVLSVPYNVRKLLVVTPAGTNGETGDEETSLMNGSLE